MATNHSRPVKFDPGTLVKWVRHDDDRTFVVDHNSGQDLCWIAHRDMNQPIPVSEVFVRALTFREFAWFRHPLTGHLMSGKTRGYMAAIIHLFTALLFGASIAQEATWWSAFALIPVAGYWLGTWMNYTGRWK